MDQRTAGRAALLARQQRTTAVPYGAAVVGFNRAIVLGRPGSVSVVQRRENVVERRLVVRINNDYG